MVLGKVDGGAIGNVTAWNVISPLDGRFWDAELFITPRLIHNVNDPSLSLSLWAVNCWISDVQLQLHDVDPLFVQPLTTEENSRFETWRFEPPWKIYARRDHHLISRMESNKYDQIWVCLKMLCTPLYPMVLLIIIPTKWLFHWGYSLFSDKPICQTTSQFHMIGHIQMFDRTLPGKSPIIYPSCLFFA